MKKFPISKIIPAQLICSRDIEADAVKSRPGFVAIATTPRQSWFADKQRTKTGGGGIPGFGVEPELTQ